MKNKFEVLGPWLSQILYGLKKEIKVEHFSKNPSFYRAHFGNRPQSRITNEEILSAYEKELLKGDEDLGEWIVNRWVFAHGELYRYFAEKLSEINPEFSEIVSLDEVQSENIVSGALNGFGARVTYIFSVLNGVVFPSTVFDRLRRLAEQEEAIQARELKEREEKESLEEMIARHQKEVLRIQEKCEDRIAGVMKKYTTDVNALKKQIRALQQKMIEK